MFWLLAHWTQCLDAVLEGNEDKLVSGLCSLTVLRKVYNTLPILIIYPHLSIRKEVTKVSTSKI